ncbi:hypothetical protein BC834DRAFT_608718 [Gloeopeniophorella convolvens]|nr:hypothetical protein BC834DRAFT_608718 [Gloeopeniophorella convolvens]
MTPPPAFWQSAWGSSCAPSRSASLSLAGSVLIPSWTRSLVASGSLDFWCPSLDLLPEGELLCKGFNLSPSFCSIFSKAFSFREILSRRICSYGLGSFRCCCRSCRRRTSRQQIGPVLFPYCPMISSLPYHQGSWSSVWNLPHGSERSRRRSK